MTLLDHNALILDLGASMQAAAERMAEQTKRIAELERHLATLKPGTVVHWRGSVTDLVTDLSALLTTEQLCELAGESAIAWRARVRKERR